MEHHVVKPLFKTLIRLRGYREGYYTPGIGSPWARESMATLGWSAKPLQGVNMCLMGFLSLRECEW